MADNEEAYECIDLSRAQYGDEPDKTISILRARKIGPTQRGTTLTGLSCKLSTEMPDQRNFLQTTQAATEVSEEDVKQIIFRAKERTPLLAALGSTNNLIAFPSGNRARSDNCAELAKLLRLFAKTSIKDSVCGKCVPEWQEMMANSELVARAREALALAKTEQTKAKARVDAAVTALNQAEINYESARQSTESMAVCLVSTAPCHSLFIGRRNRTKDVFYKLLSRTKNEHTLAIKNATITSSLVILRENQYQESIDDYNNAMLEYINCMLANEPENG